jgi:hypothetical protein
MEVSKEHSISVFREEMILKMKEYIPQNDKSTWYYSPGHHKMNP